MPQPAHSAGPCGEKAHSSHGSLDRRRHDRPGGGVRRGHGEDRAALPPARAARRTTTRQLRLPTVRIGRPAAAGPGPHPGRRRRTAGRSRAAARRRHRAVRRRTHRRRTAPHRADRRPDRPARHTATARRRRPAPAARPRSRDPGPAHRSRLRSRLRGRPTGGPGAGQGTGAGALRHLPDPARTPARRPRVRRPDQARWDAQSWHPDDPRIDELASALADNLLANHEQPGDTDGLPAPPRRRHPIRADQPPPRRPDRPGHG